MYLNESHMPGPTDEARQLQLKQYEACDAMYTALNDARAAEPGASVEAAYQNPVFIDKKAVYDGSVTELERLLGAGAHCCQVDCDLWSAFSDWFKSEHNFRPRGMHFTRADVLKRMHSES